ncbi:hypothetical protein [Undibacterium rugosum]|uniref:UrcA family protein n=1 Tax=Undibacterium rugosum TaxID=2762291 RepID=A0A923I658_9BURK|nr:hypothetical protein [Undibacterium rugosum]MBC3936864.1 hypothetical protein [Undibacterium rugosum]MBR7780066.1 hypothetical protein [Undibacterium rugosum]
MSTSVYLNRASLVVLFVGFSSLNCVAAVGDELKLIAEKVNALNAHFPVNSITTNDVAVVALDETQRLDQELQTWYVSAGRDCRQRFFVNDCLKKIQLERREYLPVIRRVSQEAKALQRQLRVLAADERLAKEQIKEK